MGIKGEKKKHMQRGSVGFLVVFPFLRAHTQSSSISSLAPLIRIRPLHDRSLIIVKGFVLSSDENNLTRHTRPQIQLSDSFSFLPCLCSFSFIALNRSVSGAKHKMKGYNHIGLGHGFLFLFSPFL